jgi:hypothetical protein
LSRLAASMPPRNPATRFHPQMFPEISASPVPYAAAVIVTKAKDYVLLNPRCQLVQHCDAGFRLDAQSDMIKHPAKLHRVPIVGLR